MVSSPLSWLTSTHLRLELLCHVHRLIKPEEHPVFWDELPVPMGVVV